MTRKKLKIFRKKVGPSEKSSGNLVGERGYDEAKRSDGKSDPQSRRKCIDSNEIL